MIEEYEFTFVPVYGEKCDTVLIVSEDTPWGTMFVDAFTPSNIPYHLRKEESIAHLIQQGKPFKVKMTLEVQE